MNTFMQTLRSLGVVKLAATAGITLGVIMFLIFLTTRLSTPQMSLLFSELEPTDSARIATQLESQNVPYEVSADGTRIMVPSDQAGRLRITLAEQGLTGNVIGWEIFDRDQTLGSSSFVQNINQLRALEGELARTIASLAPVRGARVHLVLPRRELFSRERQDPTASIVLKMRGSTRLDRGQVQAVQYLVATAVPGLNPANIAIIDDRGTLLARGGGEEDMFQGVNATEMRSQVEARMTRTLEQLLEPIVGIGNVRAEVRAELNFDREVINEERFDPEGQVVRSTQSSEQQNTNQEGQEPVTVGINLPDAPGAAGGAQTQSQENRTEEATNFEISKTVRNLVREAGEIKRLSVAVLVNGTTTEANEGQTQYQPRSQEELQQIDALVKSAIGYDTSRNDTVQVVNLQFAELPKDLISEEPTTYFGMRPSDIRRLAEIVVLAVVGVLVILLIVRPVIAKIFEVTPEAIARATRGGEDRPLLTDRMSPAGMGGGMLEGPMGDDMLGGPPMARGQQEVESMIDLQQVEGRVKASSIRKIGEIIDKHPEEAVAILRTWMYQNR